MCNGLSWQGGLFFCVVLSLMQSALPALASTDGMSDAQIAQEIVKDTNKIIIDEFLKHELREVNVNVTRGMLAKHPSLEFFNKQAERSPLKSLLFLEEQVHKLQDAQKNIDSLPYSLAFSADEKKKILGLKPVADRIVSYGIPLMKRDFMKVILAAKELADKRHKHPMALIPDESFRDAIYRHVETSAAALDSEMGKLSEGELISMRLGWVLEQVRVTKLWLVINDNRLPNVDDYMVFRKKRSAYWEKRLNKVYSSVQKTTGSKKRTAK